MNEGNTWIRPASRRYTQPYSQGAAAMRSLTTNTVETCFIKDESTIIIAVVANVCCIRATPYLTSVIHQQVG